MKLLLTSAGFTNSAIISAFGDLTKRPYSELNLAFIPTAANVEVGDKSWLIEDFNNCKKLGFAQVDIVDVSALPKDAWLPRLTQADVIFVGGGNVFHLMNWFNRSGLTAELPALLQSRIYVGLSAGSMVVSKWWSGVYDKEYYDEPDDVERYPCLGYVDFHVMPHFGSDKFPKVTLENMQRLGIVISEPIYVLDDNSAVKVVDDAVEVISEGDWTKIN